MADPLDACSPLKPANITEISEAPFVVVSRGNCTFVTKVTYA